MQLDYLLEEDFPSLRPHTSIVFLQRCEGYYAAKHGDLEAARRVVARCVKSGLLPKGSCNACVLPVVSSNMLPVALAERTSLPICKTVRKASGSRRCMNGIERLINKPTFFGFVEKDKNYILVDDVVTQGGTLSALRKFVIDAGGNVVGAIVLAQSVCSGVVAPKEGSIKKIEDKFGKDALGKMLSSNSLEFNELTNAQIEYMLRFKNISRLEHKIAAQACRIPIKHKKLR